jgi:GxxExxY protein
VEIKAVNGLVNEHRAQLRNYLATSGLQLGLLVNFGHYPGLQIERIVRS